MMMDPYSSSELETFVVLDYKTLIWVVTREKSLRFEVPKRLLMRLL